MSYLLKIAQDASTTKKQWNFRSLQPSNLTAVGGALGAAYGVASGASRGFHQAGMAYLDEALREGNPDQRAMAEAVIDDVRGEQAGEFGKSLYRSTRETHPNGEYVALTNKLLRKNIIRNGLLGTGAGLAGGTLLNFINKN